MNKAITLLGLIAAIALPQGVIAQQAIYNSPHKWTDSFGKIRVYIPGQPDTVVDVVTESSREYSFAKNTCGWISLRESATRKIKSFSSPSLSSSVNFSTVNVDFVHGPLCQWNGVDGWSWWENLPSSAEQSSGTLWRVTGTNQFFIKIFAVYTGSVSVQGTITYENTIKNKINTCGFGTIVVSTTLPMVTFKVGATNYTLASLSAVTKPQICRIQSGVKIRYLPLN